MLPDQIGMDEWERENMMTADADAYDGEGLAEAQPATDYETVFEEDAA